jgi:hypothetical protein
MSRLDNGNASRDHCRLIRDRRLLWVYCRECGRERDVDPATLPLAGDYPVPDGASEGKWRQ